MRLCSLRNIYERFGEWEAEQSYYELALIFSFPIFISELRYSKLLLVASIAYYALLLARKPLRHNGWLLLVWSLAFTLYVSCFWYVTEDHVYLGACWSWALCFTCFDRGNKRALLHRHARLLTGLTFLCATFWKVRSFEYLNGTMFEFMLMFDSRFANSFGTLLLGFTPETIFSYQEQLKFLAAHPQVETTLAIGASMNLLAKFLSWYGLILELLIAVLFLLPETAKCARFGPWALLLFCVTVYGFCPVVGFGALLLLFAFVVQGAPFSLVLKLLLMGVYVAMFGQFFLWGGEPEYLLLALAPLGPVLCNSTRLMEFEDTHYECDWLQEK